jgi:uroporphyrinogen decarboxylase
VNSRERVLTALDHREPDRVPITFGCPVFSSIFDAPPHGYRALCAHLGVEGYEEPRIFADSNTVENADPRLLDRFGADLRWVCAGLGLQAEPLGDGKFRDPWYGIVVTRAGAFYDAMTEDAPLRGSIDIADVDRYPYWPDDRLLRDPAMIAGAADEARRLRAAGFPVVAIPGSAMQIFHFYEFLRGFDSWLMDMYDNPRFYHALCERLLEVDLRYLETFLPPIADHIDLLLMGEDLGSQRSLFMSPEMYREFCKPYQRRWIEAARQLAPKARIVLHTCGNVSAIIPDFIQIGVDVLNPVQPRAAMMEPWRIKRDFGDALSFLGGFDIQELLPFGTLSQILDGARELIDTYGPGGGFVFSPAHQILPEVPPENIVAMYDGALVAGDYPLGASPRA